MGHWCPDVSCIPPKPSVKSPLYLNNVGSFSDAQQQQTNNKLNKKTAAIGYNIPLINENA